MKDVQERGWLASGPMSEDEKRKLEAVRLGVPFVTLGRDDISVASLVLIPEPLSRTANIVAYNHGEEGVEVALLDMADLAHIDFLRATHRVQVRLTDRASIKHALVLYQKHLKEKFAGLIHNGKDAADSLLRHALESGAQYVHLEPAAAEAAGIIVMYRVEGVLREAIRLPHDASIYIIEHLKRLAKLFPITTTVQEGGFSFMHEGQEVGVVVNTVPTARGEKVTMRLARHSTGVAGFSLQSLGLHGEALEQVHDALQRQKKAVLVAGMGDSGKTTLLYTMLDHITAPHRAVATVESHVEHRLPRVHQTATRPDLGLGTSAALRAVLKQDPDAVMVDDISNADTAQLLLEAAQRGVFMLGALEARSAANAVEYLVSEGIDRELLEANIRLVVAQRVVRKVAPHAKRRALTRSEGQMLEEKVRFAKVLAALKTENVVHEHTAWKDVVFYSAENEHDYQGLVGVQEVLAVGQSPEGHLTLLEDALFKAVQGQTSIEEVMKMI